MVVLMPFRVLHPPLLSIVVVGRLFGSVIIEGYIGCLLYWVISIESVVAGHNYTLSFNNNRLSFEHLCVEVGSPTM